MIDGIDSVALAVPDLPAAIATFSTAFGLEFGEAQVVEDQQVVTAWASFGGVSLQLLAPTADSSPVDDFLRKRGEGVMAVTLRVDDLEESRSALVPTGVATPDAEVIDAGYAKEIPLRPSQLHGVLFVLRTWG